MITNSTLQILVLAITIMNLPQSQYKEDIVNHNQMLEHLVRPAGVQAPTLILLHGFGSNEQSMFKLSSQIPKEWLVISVRAPFQIGYNAYKWYDVAMVNGQISLNIDHEEQSRKKLIEFIDQVLEKYSGNKDRVIVAGFSQGANMSLALGLTAPDKVKGFACFSGRYLEEITPFVAKSIDLNSSKAFIAHGSEDQMLPFSNATETVSKLKALGLSVDFYKDKIGHTISDRELIAFIAWLKS